VDEERQHVGPEAARRSVGLSTDPDVRAYYEQGREAGRLLTGGGLLEFARTQEIVRRHLPPPPARVLDVGGGAGIHSAWLAGDGHRVHLVDPIEVHVAQALEAGAGSFTASLGDARALEAADATYDAVLLLGPLYHLVERPDRLTALREARRAVRRGGLVFAAAISRFASLFDSLLGGFFTDPAFAPVLRRTLRDGRHANPTGRPRWFTTAHFHHSDELRDEMVGADLELVELVAIEGPGWLLDDLGERWSDRAWREALLEVCRALEAEPTLLGSGGHLMAVGRRPGESGVVIEQESRSQPDPAVATVREDG
jgi:2-polyprenyl-3-methyl-5-hydroxy-6-metoxy-1,4-benzoquinol methylase